MEIKYKPKPNITLPFNDEPERLLASRSVIIKHGHRGEPTEPREVILFLVKAEKGQAIINYIGKKEYDSDKQYGTMRGSQYKDLCNQIEYYYSIPSVDKTREENIKAINDHYVRFLVEKYNELDEEDAFNEIQSENLDMTDEYARKNGIDKDSFKGGSNSTIMAYLIDYISGLAGK